MEDNKKYENFINWLKSNGALFPNISFPAYFENNTMRGISVISPIPPYTAFFHILRQN